MQIVETANEGLKRAYTVTIPAGEIEARIEAEVKKVAPQVRMPGFRPGKVPANLVRKMHGEALHSDALNASLRESVDALLREKQLRPALQPKIDLGEGYKPGQDAELSVELEVLPDIEAPSLDGVALEKLTVPATDEAVEEALARLAAGQKSYADAEPGHAAGQGDQLIIDFVGRLDGEVFEGGTAEGAALVIGSGQFIPGFEEQLTGATAGEERTIAVTFPDDYPAATLKGREAEFTVTVQAVKVASETQVDEDFATSLGLESLDQLKGLIRAQVEQETAGLTRTQMKRQLLDHLAAGHNFPVPPAMVEAEFEQIWQQLQAEIAKDDDPEAGRKEIEAEREDYRRIAERRVRLGLLLSEIGQKNGIEITQQEMAMLMQQAAQQYRPQDRERFMDYIRSEPMAMAQLRAPLYEDKVVDFLFDKATIIEREVTRAELEAAIEAEEGTATSGAPAADADAEPAAQAGADPDGDADGAATRGDDPGAADTADLPAEKPARKTPARKAAAPAGEDAAAKAPARKPSAPKSKAATTKES